jgi:ferredoxin
MKSTFIDFYYFSGTGNTLLAVRAMAEYFQENNFTVAINRIEKSKPKEINLSHTIGLAFPVAVQSTYPFVWKFINNLPEADGTDIFMLDTMGAFSGGLVGPLKRVLKKKGYNPIGAKEIVMPNNFTTKQGKQEKHDKIIDKGMKTAKRFAHDLHFGVAKWNAVPIPNLFNKISTNKKVWDFTRKKMELHVIEHDCIKCGICYQLCPVFNINMEEFPEFNEHCEFCMRCYSYCPTDAIKFKNSKFVAYQAVPVDDILDK